MSTPTTTRATGVITVRTYEPAPYDESSGGPVLSRIHVTESFSGDITGEGVVEFLQAARADDWASFVGIERVTGPRGRPLVVDAKVTRAKPSWWLEEAFRGH